MATCIAVAERRPSRDDFARRQHDGRGRRDAFRASVARSAGDPVGVVTLGEGGTSTGAFHEGMNLAAVEKLPMIVAITNNQFSYSTPNNRQFACHDLVDRALGYGSKATRWTARTWSSAWRCSAR